MNLHLTVNLSLSTENILALTSIPCKLDALLEMIQKLSVSNQLSAEEISKMGVDLTALKAAVAKEATITQSAITLIQNIAAQLKQNSGDQAAVDDLANQLNMEAVSLADAVSATPGSSSEPAPEPTPEPAPAETPATPGSTEPPADSEPEPVPA